MLLGVIKRTYYPSEDLKKKTAPGVKGEANGVDRAAHNMSNTEQGRQHARSALEDMGINPDE